MKKIRVIIPAYNEEKSVNEVINAIPSVVEEIIVANNGSTDSTAKVAKNAGATVVSEPRMGYGYACLKGIDYISSIKERTDIVVFLDADFSDEPECLTEIVQPILNGEVPFVLGTRIKKLRDKGSMTPPQIFGNDLACFLMKLFYRSTFTDLGPFRAIEWEVLKELNMKDTTYGWTIEMQLKVIKQKIPYKEVPVPYKKRIGVSKVSGTIKGVIFAGFKILFWIFKFSFKK